MVASGEARRGVVTFTSSRTVHMLDTHSKQSVVKNEQASGGMQMDHGTMAPRVDVIVHTTGTIHINPMSQLDVH